MFINCCCFVLPPVCYRFLSHSILLNPWRPFKIHSVLQCYDCIIESYGQNLCDHTFTKVKPHNEN